ncbi:iron-sulfur cluster biosynthesis family protein [Heyndrickxia acidicola]|uniref:Iron-sulfur cluster biosynthesis family protein n=1 Tax=Heyndrickxia acidicola TaxID=209389 RepID=A0ABU6MKN3_9BACI|nr:iron-sulfur cluster biosynthesis family protein [Heyndrickxia acidicola]MED1203807.1 iron-sulfur cluster biosynthesis family protein [Heyndrickxia acidicola]
MEIVVKASAALELKKYHLLDGEGVRIQAVYVGSCALYVDYSLIIDRISEQDDVFEVEGIPFILSKESQKHLYHRISLDFSPVLGYKLSSDEETYRYNLKLERVSSSI